MIRFKAVYSLLTSEFSYNCYKVKGVW